MAVILYTGVRVSNAALFGRQMERDGGLHFTESKNKARNPKVQDIPVLSQLRDIIDATPSGNFNYMVTEYGKPFLVKGLSQWFRKRCDEAGLPQCSAHGLRKAAATIAADNGATEHQLMAIFGWDSPKQAAVCTRKTDRKRLAEKAMHLIVPEQNTHESVPLSATMEAGGALRGKR